MGLYLKVSVIMLLLQLLKIEMLIIYNDQTNYRLISIEPICAKLFEQCLVPVLEPFLCFHSNQFGFVLGSGCNKA